MVAGRTEDFARILILGNSGSGKSWLSRELGERLKIAAIDLDTVHWELEGFQVARDKDSARAIVRRIASQDIWIMEGVYGWLAQEILSRATALIWLDMPPEDCLDNLRRRGLNPGSDEKSFAALLAWAAAPIKSARRQARRWATGAFSRRSAVGRGACVRARRRGNS